MVMTSHVFNAILTPSTTQHPNQQTKIANGI